MSVDKVYASAPTALLSSEMAGHALEPEPLIEVHEEQELILERRERDREPRVILVLITHHQHQFHALHQRRSAGVQSVHYESDHSGV